MTKGQDKAAFMHKRSAIRKNLLDHFAEEGEEKMTL